MPQNRRQRHRWATVVTVAGLLGGGMLGIEHAPAGESVGGSWFPGGDLVAGRYGHLAVALPAGRVLVLGGINAQGVFATSAERYEPDLAGGGAWVAAGAPAGNTVHSATALSGPNCGANCGKVLVIGSTTQFPPMPQVQLYTPPAPGDAGPGQWASAAAPALARLQGHTATLLADGKVLVAGGEVANSSAEGMEATTELFDPAGGPAGSWISAGSMTTTRVGHRAARLENGKVLVVGGHRGPTDSSSVDPFDPTAELYDPATRTWQATGGLQQARRGFSLTALGDDGRALVAGGTGTASGTLASAEVYDPGAGQWSETDPLVVARWGHTATALPDGRTMVVGGNDLASAEVFDPATSTWSSAGGALARARRDHRATLLGDGRVLVAGGQGEQGVAGSVEIFHPSPAPPPAATLDPLGGLTASPGRAITLVGTNLTAVHQVSFDRVVTPRFSVDSPNHITAVVPPGIEGLAEVVVTTAGGSTPGGPGAMVVVVPAGTWTVPGTMTIERRSHTATLLPNGKVLIAGGCGIATCGSDMREEAEIYDPATGRSTPTANMLAGRYDHVAALLDDGRVLVYDALINGTTGIPAEFYDPGTERWTPAANPATVHPFPTATKLADGRVLVVGGNSAELYDPEGGLVRGTWSPAGALAEARRSHTATLLDDGRVLVVGGFGPLGTAEVYDPATNFWTSAGSMATPRWLHSATLLADGRVLVAGGYDDDTGEGLASAEIYDPAARTWSATGALHHPVYAHSATALPDGTVLVVRDVGELYDPASGTWALAGAPLHQRSDHTATLIPDGPASACGTRCGQVVVTGGFPASAIKSIEAFTPRPGIAAVAPASGPAGGGTAVAITGTGLAGVTSVRFGDAEATSVSFDPEHPDTKLVAVAPPHAPGVVNVQTAGAAGASFASPLSYFAYTVTGVATQVGDLVARAMSNSDIDLAFSAADTGGFPAPAGRYVIKQSREPIDTDAAFDAAPSLCEGPCVVSPAPAAVGAPVVFGVSGLTPGTTYHYAMRAVDASGGLGPRSNPAAATTLGQAPVVVPPVNGCPALPAPGANQVAYPGGYSLVGLPAGTSVGADSPLYGWFDQGGGGSYSVQGGAEAVASGRGYWGWFSCGRVVDIAGAGQSSAASQLGAYHASMVGNPSSTSPARVSGHDFAALWDAAANGGTGGYAISGYRDPQSLAVGAGSWVFAYTPTQITVAAQG